MAKGQSLQDPFLNALRREKVPVSIYLVNGIKLQGQIDSFDQFVVRLPALGYGTMDIEQAASAVLAFKPGIVYPYHYRGRPDMSDTSAFRELVLKEDETIDVRLRNWYPDYNNN